MATAQGHLYQAPKNHRSTKPAPAKLPKPTHPAPAPPQDDRADMHPPPTPDKTNSVLAAIGLADVHNHVICTDLTGAFPVTSQAGNKYMLIVYDYDSNAIVVEAMKNRSDVEALRAYANVYALLTARGIKPALNIMDNEASKAIKHAVNQSGARFELVEPNNHRVNAAERAVRTFKNHFIAGLCSTDPNFPIALWDKLTIQ
jgi:hypothetical protein